MMIHKTFKSSPYQRSGDLHSSPTLCTLDLSTDAVWSSPQSKERQSAAAHTQGVVFQGQGLYKQVGVVGICCWAEISAVSA